MTESLLSSSITRPGPASVPASPLLHRSASASLPPVPLSRSTSCSSVLLGVASLSAFLRLLSVSLSSFMRPRSTSPVFPCVPFPVILLKHVPGTHPVVAITLRLNRYVQESFYLRLVILFRARFAISAVSSLLFLFLSLFVFLLFLFLLLLLLLFILAPPRRSVLLLF